MSLGQKHLRDVSAELYALHNPQRNAYRIAFRRRIGRVLPDKSVTYDTQILSAAHAFAAKKPSSRTLRKGNA